MTPEELKAIASEIEWANGNASCGPRTRDLLAALPDLLAHIATLEGFKAEAIAGRTLLATTGHYYTLPKCRETRARRHKYEAARALNNHKSARTANTPEQQEKST